MLICLYSFQEDEKKETLFYAACMKIYLQKHIFSIRDRLYKSSQELCQNKFTFFVRQGMKRMPHK